MTLHITCPNCNFSKTIPKDKVPPGVRWAKCPVCGYRFEPEPLKGDFALDSSDESVNREVDNDLSPWEQRDKSGVFASLFSTFISVLFSPGRFFGPMTSRRGIYEPLAFGILLGSAGTMFGLFWNFLIMPDWLLSGLSFLIDDIAVYFIFTGILFLSPIFVILKMFLLALLFHVCLIILRGGSKGFKGTFRVTAFSQATQLFDFFPFIGGFISFIWNIIVIIVGLARIHETSCLRVIFALALPVIIITAGVSIFVLSLANLLT